MVGKDYPLGQQFVKEKAKEAFFKNSNIKDELELKRAVHRGRYMVKELIGVVRLKKYRTLRKRYNTVEGNDSI